MCLCRIGHKYPRTKPLADSLVKNPSLRSPLMFWALLVILTYPEHNDSCMDGVAAAPHPACPLQERKESPHEEPSPSVSPTSTDARRPADSQLLAPYH